MFTPRTLAAAAAVVLASLLNTAPAGPTLTYPDLVNRLTDLARLATLPERGETCAQWSSYDRASRYDEKTGKYVAWDANGDGNGVIRTEGDRVVMAEMKGPGLHLADLVGRARQGHVKIYLDGQPEPVVDMPFAHYFDGKHAPFAYPALSYNLADVQSQRAEPLLADPLSEIVQGGGRQGLGQLLPFQLRDLSGRDQRPHVQRASWPPNTPIELKAVNDFFADRLGTDPAGKRPGQETLAAAVRVAPGQTAQVARLDGPRAITACGSRSSSPIGPTRWPPCASWPCGSPGTASRSRPSGARWAISSARPRA